LAVGKRFNESVTVVYPAANFAVGDMVTNALSATVTAFGGSPTTLHDSVAHEIVVPSSKLFFRKSVDVNRFTYEGKQRRRSGDSICETMEMSRCIMSWWPTLSRIRWT